ncbi:MAG: beta-lactamase family protein [Gammaproteobacteria bacterium]|nr:beta-lactamase family protein [Gammaproteobacteria bacterium]
MNRSALFRRAGWPATLRVLLLAALVPGLFQPAFAAPVGKALSAAVDYSTLIARMRDDIPALLHQHKTPGLAIALVDGNRVVWKQGFGKSVDTGAEAVSSATRFGLGSASSLVIADAVLHLAEQNRIDIDKPVSFYLPGTGFRNRFNDKMPTVRDLLSHHGGLPSGQMKGRWIRENEQVTGLPTTFDLVAPPRHVYVQSMIGSELLARLVSKVSGQDYEEYVAAHIFGPSGMKDALYDDKTAGGVAGGHLDRKLQPRTSVRDRAATGLFVSIDDMSAYLSKLIVRPSAMQRLAIQNADVRLDLGSMFAYGWALSAFDIVNAGPVAHFSGEALHYQSQLVMTPYHNLAVAVLANAAESRTLVDELARRILAGALQLKAGIEQGATPRKLAGKPIEPAGEYATWKGYAKVFRKGRHWRLRLNDTSLFLIEDGEFYRMQYRLLGIMPIKVPELEHVRLAFRKLDGKSRMVSRFKGWDFLFGEQVQHQPLQSSWRERPGRYRVINPDSVVRLSDIDLDYRNGLLLLSYNAPPYIKDKVVFPIEPISGSEAVISGIGRDLGQLVRFTRVSGRNRIELSGYVAEQQ